MNDGMINGLYELRKQLKSERVQLLIRPYIKAKIKEFAEADGISFNEYINRVLEREVEENEKG